LILLPLAWRFLGDRDLGMYWLFLRLMEVTWVLDFGFSASLARFVSYAAAGARELQSEGVAPTQAGNPPNLPLLWQLVGTAQALYRRLSLLALVLLATGGSVAIGLHVADTSQPRITWIAWILAALSAVLELYAGWWNNYLRGMNEVRVSAMIQTGALAVRLVIAASLFFFGAGLLALPIAILISSLLQRSLARHRAIQLLGNRPSNLGQPLIAKLWPTSWRIGVQYLSNYVATLLITLLCAEIFRLEGYAAYDTSLRLAAIAQAVAGVWVSVKWPVAAHGFARHDLASVRHLLLPRFWYQNFTYLACAAALVLGGPYLLAILGTGKQLLPTMWFVIMLVHVFFEMQMNFWTTLVSLENRVRSMPSVVVTSAMTVLGVAGFLFSGMQSYGALVIPPVLAYMVFHNWYWPWKGARTLGMHVSGLLIPTQWR